MNKLSTTLHCIVLLLAALALTGCTSVRTVTETSSIADQVAAGDKLVVHDNAGRIVDMTLQAVEVDRLIGTLAGDGSKYIEVPLMDVDRIEVKPSDRGKTPVTLKGITRVKLPILVLHGTGVGQSGFRRAPGPGRW